VLTVRPVQPVWTALRVRRATQAIRVQQVLPGRRVHKVSLVRLARRGLKVPKVHPVRQL